MRYLAYLTIIFLISSCGSNSSDEGNNHYHIVHFSEADIKDVHHLKHQIIDLNASLNPNALMLLENHLAVNDLGSDSILHFYDLSNFNKIKKVGVRGNGPGEITDTWLFFEDESPNKVWTLQMENRKMSLFSANQADALAESEIQTANEAFFNAFYMAPTNDSSFICMMFNSYHQFTELSHSGDTIATYGDWRVLHPGKKLPPTAFFGMHQGRFASSPQNSLYILPCYTSDIMEVFNHKNKNITSIRGPINHRSDYAITEEGTPALKLDTWYKHYAAVSISKDHIYGLYSGEKGVLKSGLNAKRIFRFNHDGQILSEYKLDLSLESFQVSERHNKIYGLSDEVEGKLVIYDLPI
ncbi:MAG: hypothetical protein JJU23_11705 [Cyclobacteriaceae bacterium]|nr:hypothetical protein [Cyclobacteriaceae bacterium]